MEKVRYELTRFDRHNLGKSEPKGDRVYRVTRYTYLDNGDRLIEIPQPDVLFSHRGRKRLLKTKSKLRHDMRGAVPFPSGVFTEEQKQKLRFMRQDFNNFGETDYFLDLLPVFSLKSILDELD